MKRYTKPEEIKQAALDALDGKGYVAIHEKTPNRITVALKVRSVQDDSITFDRSAYGQGAIEVPIANLNYLEW
jgi:hypothetical protein